MALENLILVTLLLAAVGPVTGSPLGLGATLLTAALCSTMIVSFTLGSWFGFILFLIYITGLLVIFGYMSALSPNNFNSNTSTFNSVAVLVTLSVLLSHTISVNTVLSPHSTGISSPNNIIEIYTSYSLIVYWVMATILFVVLVIVVSICYNTPNPLRMFLN